MPPSTSDLTRRLDRWLLQYEEKPPGRLVVRDGGRWLTLVRDDGRWQWPTAKAQGTVADDAALESRLSRVLPG